jgi:hypothetical protein
VGRHDATDGDAPVSAGNAARLAAREDIDAAARGDGLVAALAAWRPPGCRLSVVDIGGDGGANLRYLARHIGGPQDWLLVDRDAKRLAEAREEMGRWAARQGGLTADEGERLVVRCPAFGCTVRGIRVDISRDLGPLPLAEADLVTASALIGRVSEAWLGDLVARCLQAGAAVLFALNADGRVAWDPPHWLDGSMRQRVARCQRLDRGFGPALGPTAVGAAAYSLEAVGYATLEAESDWQLGPAEAAMQQALMEGWLSEALSVDPGAQTGLRDWRAFREAAIADGASQLRVGHRDLFAWPRPRGSRRSAAGF